MHQALQTFADLAAKHSSIEVPDHPKGIYEMKWVQCL